MKRKLASSVVAGAFVLGVSASAPVTAMADEATSQSVPTYSSPSHETMPFERVVLRPAKTSRLVQYAPYAKYLDAVCHQLSNAVNAGDAARVEHIAKTAVNEMKTIPTRESAVKLFQASPTLPTDERYHRFVQRTFADAPSELSRSALRVYRTGKPETAQKHIERAVSMLREIAQVSHQIVVFQNKKTVRESVSL